MITRKAEELSVAFPPGHNLDVKRLINKLCKDIQVCAKLFETVSRSSMAPAMS